jgi:hypothetical protein|tara:strand:- start:4226 stop:5056 length:831 start_codon:yes stop_codon:yes gene_type:complete
MYNKNLLTPFHLPNLNCAEFTSLRDRISFDTVKHYTKDDFIEYFEERIGQYKLIKIEGLDRFKHKDLIMGCHHFIDNLLLKYNIENLQIFEHDYNYYKKLKPDIIYTTIDTISADKPLLMAMPFPGHLGLHRQFEDIMNKCEELGVEVHLDGSWLPASFNINYNLQYDCIKSVAMSLSKAYGMGWNRIGLRWSKQYDDYDSITIMNKANMIHKLSYQIGCFYLDNFSLDHLVNKYKAQYDVICKDLKLRPSNIIHAAFSIDRSQLYGVKELLVKSV